jgi:hypothetical protein
MAPTKIFQDIRIMSTPAANSSSVICTFVERHIREIFPQSLDRQLRDLTTSWSWESTKAYPIATQVRPAEVTDASTRCTRFAGDLGSYCPDSLFIRISVASHDIKSIGTYLCWRREGRNDRFGSQTQATASRRQLVCRDGGQSRDVDALFKRVSRLCTNCDTLFGVLNAVFKIAAAFGRWGGCVTTRRSRTLPLSSCSSRRRDGPSCLVSKVAYT